MSFDPDAKFERALLDSARGDAQPRDVPHAWARFAEALAAAPGAVGGRGDTVGGPLPGVTSAAAVRGARVSAVKWLLLGALAGAVPTAAFVVGHRPAPMVAPVAVSAAPASPGARSGPGLPSEAPPATRGAATPPLRRAATANAAVRLCRAAGARGPATANSPSTLSAEVSRIDTARTASALGDHEQAVSLVEHYHRDFPRGALGPDADIVALEAAAAQRDQPEVARRAALFLARYPNDPHAARVRELVARAPAR